MVEQALRFVGMNDACPIVDKPDTHDFPIEILEATTEHTVFRVLREPRKR